MDSGKSNYTEDHSRKNSCGFLYLLCVLLLMSVGFAALVVVMKWYRYRKKEDVLTNEQVFAERYYSK